MTQAELQMPIKVWYKPLPKVSNIRWPILDILLSSDNIVLPQPVLSLVDSGASISILHTDLASVFGFTQSNLGRPTTATSVSGSFKSWRIPKPIGVNIYGHNFSFAFEITDNPNLVWPCILGEDSIFQVAKIDFQKYKGFFEIRFRQDIH